MLSNKQHGIVFDVFNDPIFHETKKVGSLYRDERTPKFRPQRMVPSQITSLHVYGVFCMLTDSKGIYLNDSVLK